VVAAVLVVQVALAQVEMVGLSQHLEVVSPTQVEAEAELGLVIPFKVVVLVVVEIPEQMVVKVWVEVAVALFHIIMA
jgi:hypothetical protein